MVRSPETFLCHLTRAVSVPLITVYDIDISDHIYFDDFIICSSMV